MGCITSKILGCPIPIIYDDKGKAHPVPKEMLPVKLPENINLKVKGNPLIARKIGKKLQLMELNILEKLIL